MSRLEPVFHSFEPEIPSETFCNYLAKQFVSKKGFSVGAVPEAQQLIGASDVVLTLHHGVPFTILCLIDREANPGKTFDLPLSELEAIAADCQKYSVSLSSFGSTRMPVVIRVIEIGEISEEQWAGLEAIGSPVFSRKFRISALAVDPLTGTVRSNSRRDKAERTFIESILEAPRQSESDIQPFVAVELTPKSTPYLTWALIGALAAIFATELGFGIEPSKGLGPSIRTLIALGGLQYLLAVGQGEWWRIFTGPLLHANLIHIALNSVALFLAGSLLERAVGRLWFAALFVIGGLGGACGSLLVNPHNLVSVGASGAIMGLFAAMFVLSFRYTNGQDRSSLQRRAIQVLIPSLLPLASTSHDKIDYGAHAGGAVIGALAGLVLLKLWQHTDMRPPFRKFAAAIIVLGVLGAAVGGASIVMKYHFWEVASRLIPSTEVPKTDAEIRQPAVQRWLEKYPDDPRSHFYNAIVLIRAKDLPGAERELRTALSQQFALDQLLAPAFKKSVQGLLALALVDEQRMDDAREAAAPVCLDPSAAMSAKLKELGLCTNAK
jgi:rhomboid protease GluP